MRAELWKVIAIALLLASIAMAGVMGYYWNLAAHDRDQAAAALVVEKAAKEELQAALREQNRAVETLSDLTIAADVRGQQARQLAAANGRRLDDALARERGATAITCADAMPVVKRILEATR